MNLEKLFQTQKVLRDRIDYNEPDRFEKLILALLVELGECANEWRGFKFWSVNQIPHTSAVRVPAMMEEDKEYYNPLLEEYVDGLHFILEIGLELHAVDPWQPSYEEDITEQFRTIYYHVSLINSLNGHDEYEYAVSYFLGLGEMFGFTHDEIEQAYFAKNKINHQRQEVGY
jgi:dimeric dUTPase (all-alpha-NTP-PPase superfamily)